MTPPLPDLSAVATDNATARFNLIWANAVQEEAFQQVAQLRSWFQAFHVDGYKAGVRDGAAAMLALSAGAGQQAGAGQYAGAAQQATAGQGAKE